VEPRPKSLRQWVALVFSVIGVGLVPWAVWLSSTLQPDHVTHRWDLAWSVFDGGLALGFLGTGVAAWLRSPWVAALAAATGTLLLTDAWFDVILESHGNELRTAIFEAVVFELPVAGLCFWIAYRTEKFLVRAVHMAYGGGAVSHVAAAAERAPESDLVGVLEVAADGEPARKARDPDPAT
jgi:hypothetical protein